MSAEPSPHERFRRALSADQVDLAMIAATDLPRVDLGSALELCVLLAKRSDHRFPRAASRWLSRFVAETGADLPRTLMAGAALAGLQNSTTRQECADRLAVLIR